VLGIKISSSVTVVQGRSRLRPTSFSTFLAKAGGCLDSVFTGPKLPWHLCPGHRSDPSQENTCLTDLESIAMLHLSPPLTQMSAVERAQAETAACVLASTVVEALPSGTDKASGPAAATLKCLVKLLRVRETLGVTFKRRLSEAELLELLVDAASVGRVSKRSSDPPSATSDAPTAKEPRTRRRSRFVRFDSQDDNDDAIDDESSDTFTDLDHKCQ
jgi:hypothetical protein